MDHDLEGECRQCGQPATEHQSIRPGGGVSFWGECDHCGHEWSGSA